MRAWFLPVMVADPACEVPSLPYWGNCDTAQHSLPHSTLHCFMLTN